jgi:hypothetical protein
LHRNLAEIAMPSVARAYDLGDLMLAIAPAPVTVVNPVDAMGQLVTEAEFRRDLGYALSGGAVKLLWRGVRDPLPIE